MRPAEETSWRARRHHQGPPDRGGRAALRRARHRRGQPARDQPGLGGPQRHRRPVPLRGPGRRGAGHPRQAHARRRGPAPRHARPVRGRAEAAAGRGAGDPTPSAHAGRGAGPPAGRQAGRPRRRPDVPADLRRPAQPAQPDDAALGVRLEVATASTAGASWSSRWWRRRRCGCTAGSPRSCTRRSSWAAGPAPAPTPTTACSPAD